MRRLLDNGAAVDGMPTDEKTPLVAACSNFDLSRRLKAITLLLDNGASPNPQNECKQGAIWALCSTGANENDPLHKEAFELLMKHGAKPYRGTSDLMTTFTTPLDNLLGRQDIEGFDKLLERCGGIDVLGVDDFLSFWNTVSISGNMNLMEKVILMDKEGAIARHAKTPIQTLLAMKPIPSALVTRLLEQNAKPDPPLAMSSLHSAIFHGAELDLIKQLLSNGADPNAMVAKQSILSHVISAQTDTWASGRKLAIVDLLLEAGVSIYKHLPTSRFFRLPDDTPRTSLGHAIHRKRGNQGLVKRLLEHQPLAGRRENEILKYIKEACRQGHRTALDAILSSAPKAAGPIIAQNVNLLTHLLLDNIYNSHVDGTEVSAAIDCLKMLLQRGGNEVLNDLPPSVISDQRTAKEKLLALMVSYSGPSVGKMNMVSGCFQRRLAFKAEDDWPKFKNGWD
jgi:ankyrin repeat protein